MSNRGKTRPSVKDEAETSNTDLTPSDSPNEKKALPLRRYTSGLGPDAKAKSRKRGIGECGTIMVPLSAPEAQMMIRLRKHYDLPMTVMVRLWLRQEYAEVYGKPKPIADGALDEEI